MYNLEYQLYNYFRQLKMNLVDHQHLDLEHNYHLDHLVLGHHHHLNLC